MSRYSTLKNHPETTKSVMKHIDSNEKQSTALHGEMVSTAFSYNSINNFSKVSNRYKRSLVSRPKSSIVNSNNVS